MTPYLSIDLVLAFMFFILSDLLIFSDKFSLFKWDLCLGTKLVFVILSYFVSS